MERNGQIEDMFWLRPIFGIVFGIVVFVIVFGILFNMATNPSQPSTCFFQNSFWNILGVFVLIWFISWIFFRPWRRRYWYSRWYEEDETAILRRRYAKGEITRAQYLSMMRDLKKHG